MGRWGWRQVWASSQLLAAFIISILMIMKDKCRWTNLTFNPQIAGWASILDCNMVNEDLWLIRCREYIFLLLIFWNQKAAFNTLRGALIGLWCSGGDNCAKMEGCCSQGAPGPPVMSTLSFTSQVSPGNSLYCCWVLEVGNHSCRVPRKSMMAPVQMRHLPGTLMEHCWERLHAWGGWGWWAAASFYR